MATYTKRGVKWRVEVRHHGLPTQSKTFSLKADAERWAREAERTAEQSLYLPERVASTEPLRTFLTRYDEQVVPGLRSWQTERGRLHTLMAHLGDYAPVVLTPQRLATYRDQRLRTHSAQTVVHELKLLQRILKRSMHEWGLYLPNGVPMVAMPKLPQGRNRILTVVEEQRLLEVLRPPWLPIVQLALATAARRGELMALCWEDVDLANRLLFIRPGKTGVGRFIPLLDEALAVLHRVEKQPVRIFPYRADSVTNAFALACQRAGLDGLRFHDLRHTAATRLAERGLTMQEVMLMTGHKDPRMVMRYSHLSAVNLGEKLRNGSGGLR